MQPDARWTIAQARKEVDGLDWGPVQYLKDELQRTAAIVHWLGQLLYSMLPQELAEQFWHYRRSTETQISRREVTEGEGAAAWKGVYYDIYVKERTHLLNVIRTAHQCGIEERLTQLEEQKAELLGQALFAFANKLGLDVRDASVRQAAAEALMEASNRVQQLEVSPAPGVHPTGR
jgi:flavin-binding protein dodecin